jgi:serine-aspartate repeat-containing protein C/D/E
LLHLRTAVNPSTPSDDGYYKFACIKPGMYHVKFERPGHLAASEPFKGGNTDKDSDISHEFGVNTTRKFTVLSGDMILNVGAGFQDKATLGDRVWLDRNFNGIQDGNEEPVQGVKDCSVYTWRGDGK